jgi:hypothetical protein
MFDLGAGNKALKVSPAGAQKQLLEMRGDDGLLRFDAADVPDTVRIAAFFSAEKTRRRGADTRAVPVPFNLPVRASTLLACARSRY